MNSSSSHAETAQPIAAPKQAPAFNLADSTLPASPEQRQKLFACLDNATLAGLRGASKAVAQETRPVLLARKYPEIAAAKPPAMDAAELLQQVRGFDALAKTWPQEPWQWHADAYDRKMQVTDDARTAAAKRAPKLLKRAEGLARKRPRELRYHFATMTLHSKLEHWQTAGEIAATVLNVREDSHLDCDGEPRRLLPSDHERYLAPAAFELSDLAAQHQHWTQQASYLLRGFEHMLVGYTKAHPTTVANFADTQLEPVHRMAAHVTIARNYREGDEPCNQGLAREHASRAQTLATEVPEADVPLSKVLLQRL